MPDNRLVGYATLDGMSAIDEYVAEMSARLVGPGRVKADLIAEARDGLCDAAQAYTEEGMAPARAAERAVADFGAPDLVLPHYQQELAAAQGRRTAGLVAAAMSAVQLLSPLMWWHSPWQSAGVPPSAGYLQLAGVLDGLGVTGAIIGAVTLFGLGRGSRVLAGVRLPDSALLAHLTCGGVLFLVLGQLLSGGVIYVWSVRTWPAALTWPPMVVGFALFAVVYVVLVRSAVRCLSVSGRALRLRHALAVTPDGGDRAARTAA
jgi:hypothetical protein